MQKVIGPLWQNTFTVITSKPGGVGINELLIKSDTVMRIPPPCELLSLR